MDYRSSARRRHLFTFSPASVALYRLNCRFLRCVLNLLIVLVLGAGSAIAQDDDAYLKRKVHEFEQCANVCQIEHDDRLFKCMPYRKDKEKPVEADCLEKSIDKYQRCMVRCPVDPRPGQSGNANQGG